MSENASHISATQLAVLRFIAANTRTVELTPSSEEIRAHFGWASKAAAGYHLRALRDAGMLADTDGMPRSYLLTSMKPAPCYAIHSEMVRVRIKPPRFALPLTVWCGSCLRIVHYVRDWT